MEAAKYVLRYLKHTSSHGIWFKQGENRLKGCCAIPKELRGDELLLFTDSNWGPQDASKPKRNETQTVTLEELKSNQGYFITRMGGRSVILGCSYKKNEEVEALALQKSSLLTTKFVQYNT